MRKIGVLILIMAFALAIGGCGGADAPKETAKEAAKEAPKKIIVGLDDHFPPMGFRDDKNNIVGFDIDMAKEAAKRMGMEIELKPIDWNSKEVELNSKRIDMLWNGLTITEKRKENIAFTKPYMSNRQIIIVTKDSPVKTKADLKDKVIGAQDGSTSIDAIEKEPEVLKSFKELRKYPDNVAALLDMNAGRLDAVVVDEIVGRYYIAKKPGEYVVLSDNFGSEDYGVGLRKDDKELLDKLQKALDEMKKDGASEKISKQWFGENIVK